MLRQVEVTKYVLTSGFQEPLLLAFFFQFKRKTSKNEYLEIFFSDLRENGMSQLLSSQAFDAALIT